MCSVRNLIVSLCFDCLWKKHVQYNEFFCFIKGTLILPSDDWHKVICLVILCSTTTYHKYGMLWLSKFECLWKGVQEIQPLPSNDWQWAVSCIILLKPIILWHSFSRHKYTGRRELVYLSERENESQLRTLLGAMRGI